MNKDPRRSSLSLTRKVLYGSGDWGISSAGMLRSIFYAIYLTDVVGLEPRMASFGALAGIIWDAINDPLVGLLSDRLRTRWGRRRPFLLWFAIPFGLSLVLFWYAPPWDNEIALLAYVTLAFMLADTLSTLVSVPYLSLMPEIAPGYDERTTLASFRTFFQLLAALTVVIAAPMIVDFVVGNGGTQQQGFVAVGSVFGASAILPLLLIAFFIREKAGPEQTSALPFRESLRVAWDNIPFRFAAGIHMLNWSAVDMVAVIFPFYLLYWISEGDLLAKVNVFGLDLALESAFFGLLMLVSILVVPFWLWLARRQDKRQAYMLGMSLWIAIEFMIFTVQPGQVDLLLLLAALAGVGISAAYVLPDALFADIIEWDELRTRRRQEGIYYGARSLIRKLAGALTIFITLQLLGWSGYRSPPADAVQFTQSDSALTMIRLMVGPVGAVYLSGTVLLAWLFPLNRERHARITRLLSRRKERTGVD